MKTSSTQKSLAPSTAVLPFRPPIAQVTECMTQGQIALTYVGCLNFIAKKTEY